MNVGRSIRELTFGVSDGLVSILGLVIGVASAGVENQIVILSGVSGMLAAAISMSSGVYLSNESEKLYLKSKKKISRIFNKSPMYDAIVIGITFIISGLIPILPFFFISSIYAIILSFVLTASALFTFGYYRANYTKQNPINSGLEMVFVSLLSACMGYLIGYLFRILFLIWT